MPILYPDKDWAEVVKSYEEIRGLEKARFDQRPDLAISIPLAIPKEDSTKKKYGVLTIEHVLNMIMSLNDNNKKLKEENAALKERLDSISGWLASKELQQVLAAKVEKLEAALEKNTN